MSSVIFLVGIIALENRVDDLFTGQMERLEESKATSEVSCVVTRKFQGERGLLKCKICLLT